MDSNCPLLPEAGDWGRGHSSPRPATAPVDMSGAPVPRKGRAPASDPKGPRPQPPGLSRRPRPSSRLRRKGGDGHSLRGEAGRREREGRIPQPRRSELEPAQARRRPPRPGGSRAPPAARCPPAAPLASGPCPAPPRAPALALTHRDPGAPARPRPFSPRGPGRAEPRTPPLPPGPYWLPRPPLLPPPAPARALLRAAFRSRPHRPRLSPFSRRNRSPALRPSSPAPSPLITPPRTRAPALPAFAAARPDVRCPRRCRRKKGSTAARSQGAGPCVPRRREGGGREAIAAAGGDQAGRRESPPDARRQSSPGQPRGGRRVPTRLSGRGGREDGTGGRRSPPSPPGGRPRKATGAGKWVGGRNLGNAAAALHDPFSAENPEASGAGFCVRRTWELGAFRSVFEPRLFFFYLVV